MSVYVAVSKVLDVGESVLQVDLFDWISTCLREFFPDLQKSARFYQKLKQSEVIKSRVCAVPDFGTLLWEKMQLYRPGNSFQPSLALRMEFYAAKIVELLAQAYEDIDFVPDYLLQVSCTGYRSPHGVQLLAQERGGSGRRVFCMLGIWGVMRFFLVWRFYLSCWEKGRGRVFLMWNYVLCIWIY